MFLQFILDKLCLRVNNRDSFISIQVSSALFLVISEIREALPPGAEQASNIDILGLISKIFTT